MTGEATASDAVTTEERAAVEVTIRGFGAAGDAEAFRALNEEWITKHFVLEAKDHATLGDPLGTILGKGGRILMVEKAGAAVGCVALIPMGDGVYELSKMAVAPAMRGLGVGRRLLEQVIAEGRALGARALFLGSSTKLGNAVRLYEAMGFSHVPTQRLPALGYTRADVFMEMVL